MVKLYIIVY